ncbi:MAG: efflux RND transporter periplasmic adaptor subunit [Chromatiales bacterium]|nr:efflux RND transporter periplasmic adaptor subunit [Gammaproteobacteria bacterium]
MKRMNRVAICCGLLFCSTLQAQDLDAQLEWQQRVELGTVVNGVVGRVNVTAGEPVTRGALLVELDQRPLQARLVKAVAQKEAAKQQMDEAKRELDRSLELYDRTLLSDHERQLAEIDAAKADAYLRAAEAELILIKLAREYSRIKSPFNGRVLVVNVQQGQAVVNHLQIMPLVVVVNDREMKAVTAVDSEMAARLRPGQAAKVGVHGEWLPGVIQSVGLEPLAGSGMPRHYRLEVGFKTPKGQQLRLGEKAVVRIDG